MTQKIINVLVGFIAVLVISSAIFVLQTKKNSEQAANQAANNDIKTAIIDAEQNDVLGETNDGISINASIVGEENLSNGFIEIAVLVSVLNNSDKTLQFSPGIDISVFDTVSQVVYPVVSSLNTTLFGGPIETGQTSGGIVYFQVATTQQKAVLDLLYQPNSSASTRSVKL